jgi:hypothetical protein
MNTNETRGQETSESVDEQRAQWERFSMTVCENGYVNVCNQSHNDDSDHTYSVEVSERGATGCSCPHYQHRSPEGGCKHMIAVEQSPIVLSSASAASQVVTTDGGTEDDRFLPPEHPEHVPEDEYEDDEHAGSGLSTVTGWEPESYQTPEDEDVDETPL